MSLAYRGMITSTGYPVEVFFWIFQCTDEEEFSKEFEKSSGICIRHLFRIMQSFGEHPNLPLLIEKQLQKYKFLSYELAEYDRKRNGGTSIRI